MTKARDLANFLGDNTSLGTINDAYAAGTLVPSSTNPNMVINGAMEINQRGDQTGVTTVGYVLDRFLCDFSNVGTNSVTQDTDVPEGQGFSKSMKIACTATQAIEASTRMQITHRLEGFDSVQTKFGTSDAESLTLSFWIKANRSQTFGVNFENELPVGGGVDQGYQTSQTYTTANTWQKMVITISGDTRTGKGFTWNSSKALAFDICLSEAGSDSGGGTASATWSDLTQNQKCTHNTEHFADSTANYFNITGVKLELGSEATDFQHVPYGEELAKCHRYYQQYGGGDPYHSFFVAGTYNGNTGKGFFELSERMRAIPTGSGTGTFDGGNGYSQDAVLTNIYGALEPDGTCKIMYLRVTGNSNNYIIAGFIRVRASNDINAKIIFDAEL
ncbi:hypothetical protein N9Z55_06645 [Akkermansiaceae bacterium]|nr:hypothetical protein [Akkermansiaceae bacterium]